MSIRHWSRFTFWRTLPMCGKGGKAYTNLWAQNIWKASLPWLKELFFQNILSNFQLSATGSWFLVPPLTPPIFIKYGRTIMFSMQSWTDIAFFSFIVKDIIANLAPLSSQTYPPKSSLSLRKNCDELVAKFVDVEDDGSVGMLEELLLPWVIIAQSVYLVPWLFRSPLLAIPCTDSVLSHSICTYI